MSSSLDCCEPPHKQPRLNSSEERDELLEDDDEIDGDEEEQDQGEGHVDAAGESAQQENKPEQSTLDSEEMDVEDEDDEDDPNSSSALPAQDVIQLRFVRSKADVGARGAAGPHPADLTFQPTYLHQIIPDELVHGYKAGSVVAVYIHLGSLTYWVDTDLHEADIEVEDEEEEEDAMEITDVHPLLVPFIKGDGLATCRSLFLTAIHNFHNGLESAVSPEAGPMPLSNRVVTYKCDVDGEKYAVYKQPLYKPDSTSGTMTKQERFHEFHRRMMFLMFVQIEGASFIDDDDTKWEVFVVARLHNDVPSSFVGYATTYPFSTRNPLSNDDDGPLFVDRIRISQVAIVPLHQRQGHGAKLLQAIYTDAHERHAIEITVEDPSIGFRILRDVNDLQYAYRHQLLSPTSPLPQTLLQNTDAGRRQEQMLLAQFKARLLLTPTQARRCMEVHHLRFVDGADEDIYKPFRLWVKRRLHSKFEDILDECGDKADRKERLDQFYRDVEKEYSQSAKRVTRSVDDGNTLK